MIIDNTFRGFSFVFFAHVRGSNTAGFYHDPIPNPTALSQPLLNLTWSKISLISIFCNNPYKQHLPGSAPDPKTLFITFQITQSVFNFFESYQFFYGLTD